MSKLAEELRDHLKIFNPYGLIKRFGEKGKDICISYGNHSSKVWSPSHKVHPEGHFSANGAKEFFGNRSTSLTEAKSWALTHYGVSDWVPMPGMRGDYIPKEALDRAKAELAMVKAAEGK